MTRVLVAGIGNTFLGDDGFGVEVVRRMANEAAPLEVTLRDFGIRGFDLSCAVASDWDGVVMLDAAQRGGSPGTLYVIEPGVEEPAALEAHGLDPARVIALARQMSPDLPPILIVACEPARFHGGDAGVGLSPEVEAAVDRAIPLVREVVARFTRVGKSRA